MKCIKSRIKRYERKHGKNHMFLCTCAKCFDRSGEMTGLLDGIFKVSKKGQVK